MRNVYKYKERKRGGTVESSLILYMHEKCTYTKSETRGYHGSEGLVGRQ